MSSSHPIEVTPIVSIKPHPNADKLEIAQVKGWEVIVKKGEFKEGQLVVHFIPNSILTPETSDRFGVTKYLAGKQHNRVKPANLRGVPSFGFIVPPDDSSWEIGKDVADHYGVTKWEPPIVEVPQDCLSENQNPETAGVRRYTDIENGLNYPDIFTNGDHVVVTEKIHGCNVRLVYKNGKWFAASKNLFRKYPGSEDGICYTPDPAICARSRYWFPYSEPGLVKMMIELSASPEDEVVVYGEVYGKGIQYLDYGLQEWAFAAFDISINGKFMDFSQMLCYTGDYKVPTVPYLDAFEWDNSLGELRKWADLMAVDSRLHNEHTLDTGPGEGIVARTYTEQFHPLCGRKIMKVIGAAYLTGKASDEDTQDF